MMRNIQKIIWVLFLLMGLSKIAYSQLPTDSNLVKLWDKTYGSPSSDQSSIVISTKDGGALIMGFSHSSRGFEKSEDGRGITDFWLVKIDANGKKQWDKTIGTTEAESTISLKGIQTADEGYILTSSSSANKGGDKSDDNASSKLDIWVVRLDKFGQKIWDKTYGGVEDEFLIEAIPNGTGFLVVSSSKSGISGNKGVASKGGTDIWLLQLDTNGNKVWEKALGGSSDDNITAVEKIDNGFVLFATSKSSDGDNPTGIKDDWLIRIDNNGNKVWDKSIGLTPQYSITNCITDRDGNIVVVSFLNNIMGTPKVIKLNKNGDKLWTTNIYDSSLQGARFKIFITEENNIGFGSEVTTSASSYRSRFYLFYTLDKDGVIKTQEIVNKGYLLDNTALSTIAYLGNNTLLFVGGNGTNQSFYKTDNSRGGYDYWVTKFAITDNSTRNQIMGNVYNDLNANCQPNTNELGLGNILVRAMPDNHCTFTDDKGNYTIPVATTGNFTVTPVIPTNKKNLLSFPCTTSSTVTFNSLGNVQQNINFAAKALPCADLTVDISSNRRRRCFRNFTTVKYANEGYIAADNVQLKVIYPQYVVPIRSSKAWTSRQDTVITYNLGRLEAGQTGQIVITDSVVCGNESIRGLTQCTKAIITPKSSCVNTSANWDKADLQAFSQCVNANTVKLSVINVGEAAMRDSTVWRLFLNGVLKQQGKLKLAKDERYSFEILAKGSTVRLEADQTPSHPVGKYALTTLERCGGVIAFSAAPSAVQLPINITPIGEETATSCMPIIDSYDPNDKQVIPAGVGANNIVRETDDLEFQIRFQNTGTDTAYTVVIRDTLSAVLDIASLQVGASSHNYTYTVSGKNNPIITWTFNNINLPAQKQDDAGSNGFVKFKISQMPNNAKGTKIKNKAGIYFDFNSPIITNETNLTVGDLVSDLNNATDLATIFVCNNKPQPTISQAGTDKITVADSVILAANNADKGTGMWKIVQGTGEFINPYNPKTTVKKMGLGENVYEWVISLCNTASASKVKITRMAIPKAEITSKGDTLIAEQADSYQWFFNGQPLVGATSQTFIARVNGTYTVEIKKLGVTVISPPFKHTITGIEDELLQRAISLVPNPTQSSCVLQLSNDYFGEVKISISNLLGQIVFQTTTNKNDVNLSQTIDLQSFANGVYLVQLQTTKGKVVKKLVKM